MPVEPEFLANTLLPTKKVLTVPGTIAIAPPTPPVATLPVNTDLRTVSEVLFPDERIPPPMEVDVLPTTATRSTLTAAPPST